jgi:hypothetical protein
MHVPDMNAGSTGQIAVGGYVLDVGAPCGALVRKSSRNERAQIRSRPIPILLRPKVIRGLLARQDEVAAALSALDANLPVEFSGESGVGKTALVRHLTHHPRAAAFADGVLYLPARHQSSVDLQQLIFEAFYESEQFYKPTEAEIQRSLQERTALIVLDDVRLPRTELERVIDSAPRSAFVVTTRARSLWDEARSIVLKGLAAEDAVLLLEREIERSLDATERSEAASLCVAIGGHPLRILQAAAIIRERGISLDPWARTVTPESLITELLASIDEKQRRALLALTAFPAMPLHAQHISGIAEVTDLEPSLTELTRRGLVVSSQSRYQLADGIADRLRRTEELKPWMNRAITYFTAWAERYRRNADTLRQESEALVRVQCSAADSHRWEEVLELGRLVEGALILGARWGAWAVTLERCLAAAKANRDRSAEAWALHELGSRALCLGDTGAARTMLTQAIRLRDELGDPSATAATRQNLSLVLPPVFEYSRDVALPAPGARFDLASVPIRHATHATDTETRVRTTSSVGALLVAAVLVALVGTLAWVGAADRSWNLERIASIVRRGFEQSTNHETRVSTLQAAAEPAAPQPHEATVVSLESEAEPASDPPPTPNIIIFTARPGSMTTGGATNLCYAVSDASRVRLEPHIGEVRPTRMLNCLRVTPARTTTYELTAYGPDDHHVRQQLVIVVR